MLGQNDQVVEYHPEIKPKSSWHQEKDGLHVRAMQTQRLQDNFHWPNPAVLKITNAEPALTPPHVQTTGSVAESSVAGDATGEVLDMGDSSSLQVGFEYRPILGEDVNSRSAGLDRDPRTDHHQARPFHSPHRRPLPERQHTNFAPSFTIRCWRSTVRRSP